MGSTTRFVAALLLALCYTDQSMCPQRWGDAPVHSIAAALFAKKGQIHFFDDIGYEHNPYTHCPKGNGLWKRGHCSCNPSRSFGALGSLLLLPSFH